MANRKRLRAKDWKTYMFAFRYHVPDGCFNGLPVGKKREHNTCSMPVSMVTFKEKKSYR